jgi:hypothetical protein
MYLHVWTWFTKSKNEVFWARPLSAAIEIATVGGRVKISGEWQQG